MAAKSAMIRILEDTELSGEELLEAALTSAREHRMGVTPLSKLDAHLFGQKEEFLPEITVEAAVRRLVEHAVAHRSHLDEGKTQSAILSSEVSKSAILSENTHPVRSEVSTMASDDQQHENMPTHPDTPTRQLSQPAPSTQTTDVSTQASLLPTTQDFQHLFASFKQLKSAFSDFVVESADREQRYFRKVNDLSIKIDSLTSTLETVRQEAKDTEQRLSRKVNDLTSRLSDLTHPQKKSSATTGNSQSSTKKSRTENASAKNSNNASVSDTHHAQKPEIGVKPPHDNTINSISALDEDKSQVDNAERNTAQKNSATTYAVPSTETEDTVCDEDVGTTCCNSGEVNAWSFVAKKRNGPITRRLDLANKSEQQQSLKQINAIHSTIDDIDKKGIKSSNHDTRSKLRGAVRIKRAVLYVGGVSTDCTADDLVDFCNEQHVRVTHCRMIQSRRFGSKSARLTIFQEDADVALNADFWPDHVTAREWSFDGDTGPPAAQRN